MRSGLAWDETYDLGTTITAMLYDQPDMASFVAPNRWFIRSAQPSSTSSGSTNLLCGVLRDRTGQGSGPAASLVAGIARRVLGGVGGGRHRHAGLQFIPVGDAA